MLNSKEIPNKLEKDSEKYASKGALDPKLPAAYALADWFYENLRDKKDYDKMELVNWYTTARRARYKWNCGESVNVMKVSNPEAAKICRHCPLNR